MKMDINKQALKLHCGIGMKNLGSQQTLDRTIMDECLWICLKCGMLYEEKEVALDDEDMDNLLESYNLKLDAA